MEATAAGLTTGTLGSFTVVHGAADASPSPARPTNLTSGATRMLTATIKDAAGNTVAADNSTVVAFAQAVRRRHRYRHAATPPPPRGVATKTVTGDLAGSVTMEATTSD